MDRLRRDLPGAGGGVHRPVHRHQNSAPAVLLHIDRATASVLGGIVLAPAGVPGNRGRPRPIAQRAGRAAAGASDRLPGTRSTACWHMMRIDDQRHRADAGAGAGSRERETGHQLDRDLTEAAPTNFGASARRAAPAAASAALPADAPDQPPVGRQMQARIASGSIPLRAPAAAARLVARVRTRAAAGPTQPACANERPPSSVAKKRVGGPAGRRRRNPSACNNW